MSITIYSAEFFIQKKSNYQNYSLRIVTDTDLSSNNTYIVLKQKTPVKGGSDFNYLYGYFKSDRNSVNWNDGKCVQYINIQGQAEGIPHIAKADGKDIAFTADTKGINYVTHSDIPYDIYAVSYDYDTHEYEIISNTISDIRTPYINMQYEYLNNYMGQEQTLKSKNAVEDDDFCLISQGMYYPLIRNQTSYYVYSYSQNGNINVQSCIACAVASAMEFIYYKLTGAVKIYSVSYIYGASTGGNVSSGGDETTETDTFKDVSGMYFSDAATACLQGVPIVSDIYHNKYDLPYSYDINDQYPYLKFIQKYSISNGSTYSVERITAREIYTEFKNSDTVPKDTLTTISSLSDNNKQINILKKMIKWDTDINNCAVILLMSDINGAFGSDGVIYNSTSRTTETELTASSGETIGLNHAVLIIGWVYYNNKLHWICQNSWGKESGDNGKIYVPIDYSGIINYYQVSGLAASRPNNWKWCTNLGGMEILSGNVLSGTLDLNLSNRFLDLNQNNERPALLSATEWNMFCMRINEFRYYIGLNKYNFEVVSEDYILSADRFNKAVLAIKDMSDYLNAELPSTVISGAFVYKSDLEKLSDALNSIK